MPFNRENPWDDLEQARKCTGLTQAAFGQQASLSARTVGAIERGECTNPISIKRFTDTLDRLERERSSKFSDGSLPWLTYSVPEWSKSTHGPASLLRAENQIVPFHGEQREIDCSNLVTWCSDTAFFRARFFEAEGGMGKTRLGLELCGRMERKGWRVGFANPDMFNNASSLARDLTAVSQPLLIVVDYAGDRDKQALVVALLKCSDVRRTEPWRLLLLDRTSFWIDERIAKALGSDDRLNAGRFVSNPWRLKLKPAVPSEQERIKSFDTAAKAFSDRLNMPVPKRPRDLSKAKTFDNILLIHSSALVAGENSAAASRRQSILAALMNRERCFWERRLTATGYGPTLLPVIEQLAALTNLFSRRGISQETLKGLAAKLPGLRRVDDAELSAAIKILSECYPAPAQMIGSIQPDLVREFFIDASLARFRGIEKCL